MAYLQNFFCKKYKKSRTYCFKNTRKNKIFGGLEKEAYYLFQIKGIGIPKLITYDYSGKYKILVEELLGKSLGQLFRENR